MSFNDSLNTYYLRLDGVGHAGNYQTDSQRGNQVEAIS